MAAKLTISKVNGLKQKLSRTSQFSMVKNLGRVKLGDSSISYSMTVIPQGYLSGSRADLDYPRYFTHAP